MNGVTLFCIALICLCLSVGGGAPNGNIGSTFANKERSESYGTVLDVAENSFGCTTFGRLARKAGLDKTVFNGKGG